MMIRQLFSAILLASLLGPTYAGVLAPIDIQKQADLNGKSVAMPMVNFDSLPQPTRSQTVSPLTGKMSTPGKAVATKNVDLETLTHYSTVPTKVLPQTNFTPKYGTVDSSIIPMAGVPAANVPTDRARINGRVIRPQTPAGSEELKKQLTQTP
ncbi:MAG: hypothetical protein WCS70_10775 [Verrucomicrobiota bacterium]